MAEPLAPITKPLEEMTRPELLSLATERKIVGRFDMKKEELLHALEEELTKPVETPTELKTNPVNEKPEELTAASDTQPPDPGTDAAKLKAQNAELEAQLVKDAEARERQSRNDEAIEKARKAQEAQAVAEKKAADAAAAHAAGQLTEDDRVTILRASDKELADLLADEEDPPADFVRVALVAEVARRKSATKQAQAKALVKSPNKQYRITKGPPGMRYVTPTSYVTTLPVGSIVSPLAHDMAHVQAQGFEWEPMAGLELTEDQLGNRTSIAK